MATINTSVDKFKSSPLGFLMSVIAKYQSYANKTYQSSGDKSLLDISNKASDMLDNLKIELSKTESLQKEPSNEAVLMHVIESCSKQEKDIVLECVFEYLNLLDTVINTADSHSAEGKDLIEEYYNVSRLGLLLNCYLGDFTNDDYFYGTLVEIADTVKASATSDDEKAKAVALLCDSLIDKVTKADIDLAFTDFIKTIYHESNSNDKELLYKDIICTYSESLLDKVLTQETEEEVVNRLACAKQIQRKIEKIMVL